MSHYTAKRQYPAHLIEPKAQAFWDAEETFRAWNPGEIIPASHPFGLRHGLAGKSASATELPPKRYILDMFPYPSGAGLHVGHPEGYTATDILSRYRRALGENVLHPMGWDAFGLPAEQYAVKTGKHPRITTEENIITFKRQIKALGFSYDWTREVDTTDPGYFKWTQWIFLQLYNAWFNPNTNKAEPISTLVPPADCITGEQKRAYLDARRLAFVSEAPVNWCPELGTVLANEEVIDGKSEVGGYPVVRRPMRQWMLRITAFAEKLLTDLDALDWSESLKEMQRNWIGRSEGAEVRFSVEGTGKSITVYTTRPDTLFGATYMVLSPEHALVDELTTPMQKPAVEAYQKFAAGRSDLERTDLAKDKTGVFTGAHAINPVNGAAIPIWIADYVLASYGTGAIMAVPAHDERDLEFAEKFELPILLVVQAPEGVESRGFCGEGVSVNSGFLTGLPTPEAKARITAWLEEKGIGKGTVNYKLRDWLFSRQRYWGEPFPIIWKNGGHSALTEKDLPLRPPALDDYKPTADGQPPLARATDWCALPDGATRETNTMPQWAGSCWYYLRYLDARNPDTFCSKAAEAYWMGTAPGATKGIDLYVGGAEHAVLHLLYARFWHKALHDLGHVSTAEPFFKLVNQGLILGEVENTLFTTENGIAVSAEHAGGINEEATPDGPRMIATHKLTREKLIGKRLSDDEMEIAGKFVVWKNDPAIRLDSRSFKMSKSRGNVVNPDVVIRDYGADALRLYEMFMGPLEQVKPWSMKGVEGVYRFLGRVWRMCIGNHDESCESLADFRLAREITVMEPDKKQLRTLHAAIKKVTDDLDGMRFNTAISALMVFTNEAQGWSQRPAAIIAQFLQLLAPFAPHLAEELWEKLHSELNLPATSLSYAPWPACDASLLVEDELIIAVQVNGKTRTTVTVPIAASKEEVEAAALADAKVQSHLSGLTVKKVIVVPGRLVNVVAS